MKQLLFLFFFIITHSFCLGQITGAVYDVVTHEPIDGVKIKYLNSSEYCYSGMDGNFLLNPSYDRNDSFGSIFIDKKKVFWSLNSPANYFIYTIDGKIIQLSNSVLKEGIIDLPDDLHGQFLINFITTANCYCFRLICLNSQYLLSKNHFLTKKEYIDVDSLILSKTGYYTRVISLPDSSQFIKSCLLRNEYDSIDYFNELINVPAFDMIKFTPSNSDMADIESIKIVYDINADEIYYMNSKKYKGHFTFVKNILGYPKDQNSFSWTQYTNSPERYLYPASINYFKNLDIYVLEFWAFDAIDCEHIQQLFEKILSTSYFGDKLVFCSNSQKWDNCELKNIISSNDLFKEQNYQCLNPGENYGFLKIVNFEDLPNTYFGKHDIVLVNGLPNDMSVVSGIITTVFQMPLSHINILSHNRGTPNMALKDALINPKITPLIEKLVYLKVGTDSFYIRKADFMEADSFWNKKEPQQIINLNYNIQIDGLIDLDTVNINSINYIGGKAANFSELLNVQTPDSLGIPVPEAYFAIPFYYYQQHIETYHIDSLINIVLSDNSLKTNIKKLEIELKKIQDSIISSPLNPTFLNIVIDQLNKYPDINNFKFRSSTNAEDLEIFSGAGLYDSFSGKKSSGITSFENAIKKVWASLWYIRAFQEREYYKVNHESAKMGILVHRSFPDEDANGVLITKNLYNGNSGLTINAQFEDFSVVHPEPGMLFDQIILYTFSLDPKYPYTIEYLTHSNLSHEQTETVLTDKELYQLGKYCLAIKSFYYNYVFPSSTIKYIDYAVDIEFKVDSKFSPRKIYIKQARPFK
jgi:pyruvate, water dikinase